MSTQLDTPIKAIPSNLEAERAVLGSLLIDPDAIIKIASFLRPKDFYRERHAWLYEAMFALNERREPLDFVTVVDELERRSQLEEIGGPAYIADLISTTPTAMYVDFFARIVERTAILRRLIAAAGQIAELAYDESQDVDDVVDRAEQIIFGVSESRIHRDLTPIKAIMADVIENIDFLSRNQDQLMGVPTGFTGLDRLLGGLQKSDLVILAARPSMGKTSLALNIAQNAALRHRQRVAIFSLEMSNEQLVQRLLSMHTGIDSHRLRMGAIEDEHEWEQLMRAANELSNTSIFIDDTPAASVTEIRTKSRRLYSEHGLDLILIDYMQLMTGQQGGKGGGENRQQEISFISRNLKALARELNVPVIALSQLSRAVESRADKRPMLSDLRESGCLAGDTPVFLPELGRCVAIAELEGRSGFTVTSLNTESWKLETGVVSHAFCTGVKPAFTLRTNLGRTLRTTANHKFLTFDGWKRLDELKPGDRIALPRLLSAAPAPTMTHAELALLGHLIGDGCTLPHHAIQYTTKDQDLADHVATLASSIFGSRVCPRTKQERGWLQVYLASAKPLSRSTRNPVAEWLTELGAFGLRSYEKAIPERVLMQDNAGLCVFLRHLWATDGCVQMTWGQSPRPAIYYASSSRALAYHVQYMLLRIGINAAVRCVPQKAGGRAQWHVILSGREDILRFAQTVGAFGEKKSKGLADILAHLEGRAANTNRDIVPASAWRRYAVPAMEAQGMTTRQMQAELGNEYCGATLYKHNLSRERALRLSNVVQSPVLQSLAESDVYWDGITSIEPSGEEKVYDLTVPGHHNFVAGNIVVHNSIEQDADVVLFIYRDDYYNENSERQNVADILIAKHRHGSTGSVSLYFRKELTLFHDLEINREELTY